MVGLGKTLVKEKRLFYYLESSHKIFYTTYVGTVYIASCAAEMIQLADIK